MVRWQPDAQGRLTRAALELYAERGFERTTVADIATRAGVTERTFFRHFRDKREVLFDGSATLQERVVGGVLAAPGHVGALEAMRVGLEAAAPIFDGRHEFARRRGAVVAAHPSLTERELLKLATLTDAAAQALRQRGEDRMGARLAAEAGIGAFRVAFERWLDGPADGSLAQCLRDAFARLAGLSGAG